MSVPSQSTLLFCPITYRENFITSGNLVPPGQAACDGSFLTVIKSLDLLVALVRARSLNESVAAFLASLLLNLLLRWVRGNIGAEAASG